MITRLAGHWGMGYDEAPRTSRLRYLRARRPALLLGFLARPRLLLAVTARLARFFPGAAFAFAFGTARFDFLPAFLPAARLLLGEAA